MRLFPCAPLSQVCLLFGFPAFRFLTLGVCAVSQLFFICQNLVETLALLFPSAVEEVGGQSAADINDRPQRDVLYLQERRVFRLLVKCAVERSMRPDEEILIRNAFGHDQGGGERANVGNAVISGQIPEKVAHIRIELHGVFHQVAYLKDTGAAALLPEIDRDCILPVAILHCKGVLGTVIVVRFVKLRCRRPVNRDFPITEHPGTGEYIIYPIAGKRIITAEHDFPGFGDICASILHQYNTEVKKIQHSAGILCRCGQRKQGNEQHNKEKAQYHA